MPGTEFKTQGITISQNKSNKSIKSKVTNGNETRTSQNVLAHTHTHAHTDRKSEEEERG